MKRRLGIAALVLTVLVVGRGRDHGYDAAPGRKTLWLVPGVGHADMGNIWTDAYRARVLALFRGALGEP